MSISIYLIQLMLVFYKPYKNDLYVHTHRSIIWCLQCGIIGPISTLPMCTKVSVVPLFPICLYLNGIQLIAEHFLASMHLKSLTCSLQQPCTGSILVPIPQLNHRRERGIYPGHKGLTGQGLGLKPSSSRFPVL